MKRDFLKNLSLSDEIIDKIMEENGNDINKAKGDAESLRQQVAAKDTEIEGLKGQITQRDADIKALRDSAAANEGIQQKLDELQTKYNTDTTELQKKIDAQKLEFERQTATEKFFEGVEFSSTLARDAAMAQFQSKQFKLVDGVFQGGNEWLEGLKKDSPDAFKPATTAETDPMAGGQLPHFTKGMQGANPAAQQPGAAGAAQFNGWGFAQVRGFDKK